MKSTYRRRDPALCEAAAIGDMGELENLLAGGVHPDSADSDGSTSLILAAAAGHAGVVGRLLEAGADPDEQEASGLTALMSCVCANGELDLGHAHPIFLELVELLLAAGAQIDLVDENDNSALDLARFYDLTEIVERLELAEEAALSTPARL